jgi:hypothetical protein
MINGHDNKLQTTTPMAARRRHSMMAGVSVVWAEHKLQSFLEEYEPLRASPKQGQREMAPSTTCSCPWRASEQSWGQSNYSCVLMSQV